MFQRFLQKYRPIPEEEPAQDPRRAWPHGEVRGFRELMTEYAGRGFNDGLYRLHSESSGNVGDSLIAEGFDWLMDRVYSFGYSWSGMQFALDNSRRDANDEPLVLLLDPSDGSVFQIDRSFEAFHDREIVDRPDEALDSKLFDAWSWANQHALPLRRNQVVGFKIPLALGGRDVIENMEVIDFEVEWSLSSQIQNHTRNLPEGTPFRGVKID
ncbi:MAG TPA: T6SS immunity protein Tdi1 domain-containing protein [Thermomicrobiales bacterium]